MENNHMTESGNNNQDKLDVEALAREIAWSKANVARWGVNHIILLFTLLIIIVIIVAQDVPVGIVAAVAITGLGYVWFSGWRRGKQIYASFLNEELINLKQKPDKSAEASTPQLTSRELQVLKYIAQGYANKQIARELGISENTVKHFSGRVMSKLSASGRTDAVVIAIRNGLINID